MSGIMGRGEEEEEGNQKQQEEFGRSHHGRCSSRGSRGQPGSLTRRSLEGHHLAQQLLQPAGPQVAAVIRTPRKGQGSFGELDCTSEGSEAWLGSALLQMPK